MWQVRWQACSISGGGFRFCADKTCPNRQTQNTKHKIPNTKYQTQNTKHKIPNTKHKIPNTKYQTQNTKHKTQNI
ncbi:hypothetical protein QUF72_23495, partial [Desulfobacterales bacterium HSG2]|nr:hypothetical protein [Desulfobacterales bacterium HSG2]